MHLHNITIIVHNYCYNIFIINDELFLYIYSNSKSQYVIVKIYLMKKQNYLKKDLLLKKIEEF